MPTYTADLVNRTIPTGLPVADVVRMFHLAKKVEGLSPRTLEFYYQQLNHFLKYLEDQAVITIDQVTADVIRSFLLVHAERGHNPGGVHMVYRSIKVFLRWFESEFEPTDWKNPIRKIKAPKLSKELLEPVALQDVKAALANFGNDLMGLRNKAAILFLLDTGARAREMLAVNLDDVDMITGAVMVRKGKGNKGRLVFIGNSAKKALKVYLKKRDDQCEALFVSLHGTRLSYNGLRCVLRRIVGKTGVSHFTAHGFRRAFAINMLRAGVDLMTLSRLMGHSDLSILQRYLKQLPDDLQAAHVKGGPVDNGGL